MVVLQIVVILACLWEEVSLGSFYSTILANPSTINFNIRMLIYRIKKHNLFLYIYLVSSDLSVVVCICNNILWIPYFFLHIRSHCLWIKGFPSFFSNRISFISFSFLLALVITSNPTLNRRVEKVYPHLACDLVRKAFNLSRLSIMFL